jgi:hypothetical protein
MEWKMAAVQQWCWKIAVVLRGGIGRWFKIAVVVLGGSGGRRTCDDGVGFSIIKAKGLLLQRWHQRWQGW